MSKKILGLDISSTTIGWAILDIDDKNNISFVKCDYIKPLKDEPILDRIYATKSIVSDIIAKEKPDYIGIEDLILFMPKSTATTTTTLSAFNRVIAIMAYDYLASHPGLFSVMTIRHGLKLGKILPKKEDMPELVAKHLGITFPYVKGKTGKIKEESFDMADGIAVALYYAFVLTGKIKRKVKKK
jgi:Holliday junction resolvasome RuvABC endonuclease subunit